ncbi:MAG: hypothetical protein ACC608_10175 [Anaerofustis sp.]
MNTDKTIAAAGAALNLVGVLAFSAAMLCNSLTVCYLASIFIAWGLVMMNAGFYRFRRDGSSVAAMCAVIFGGMYALCNTMVYFIQLSTVANDTLSAQAMQILDYNSFGLMFNLDLLGYCLMACSTFFAGMTILKADRGDRWLSVLLMVHGVFAAGCFVMPMLGIFSAGMSGADWIGTAMLEFWCAYFIPVGVLSIRYFRRQTSQKCEALQQ